MHLTKKKCVSQNRFESCRPRNGHADSVRVNIQKLQLRLYTYPAQSSKPHRNVNELKSTEKPLPPNASVFEELTVRNGSFQFVYIKYEKNFMSKIYSYPTSSPTSIRMLPSEPNSFEKLFLTQFLLILTFFVKIFL